MLAVLVGVLIFGGIPYGKLEQRQIKPPSEAQVTIDSGGLTTHLSRPELSGLAPEHGSYTLDIIDAATDKFEDGGSLYGPWTFKPCFPLKAGTYVVQIADNALLKQYIHTGKKLNPDVSIVASGTLRILEPVTVEKPCTTRVPLKSTQNPKKPALAGFFLD